MPYLKPEPRQAVIGGRTFSKSLRAVKRVRNLDIVIRLFRELGKSRNNCPKDLPIKVAREQDHKTTPFLKKDLTISGVSEALLEHHFALD